ncbi:hypothetical protein C8R44DRAFT_860657 [Mycena epipterygia]|nr:hypothetical protein C8R44DRAFT_860657 [Mycena epipterygia]
MTMRMITEGGGRSRREGSGREHADGEDVDGAGRKTDKRPDKRRALREDWRIGHGGRRKEGMGTGRFGEKGQENKDVKENGLDREPHGQGKGNRVDRQDGRNQERNRRTRTGKEGRTVNRASAQGFRRADDAQRPEGLGGASSVGYLRGLVGDGYRCIVVDFDRFPWHGAGALHLGPFTLDWKKRWDVEAVFKGYGLVHSPFSRLSCEIEQFGARFELMRMQCKVSVQRTNRTPNLESVRAATWSGAIDTSTRNRIRNSTFMRTSHYKKRSILHARLETDVQFCVRERRIKKDTADMNGAGSVRMRIVWSAARNWRHVGNIRDRMLPPSF